MTKASRANNASAISSNGRPHGTKLRKGAATSDPVFHCRPRRHAALQHPSQPPRRTYCRHDIDLKANPGDAPDTYATFADLYRYCYLVASVVGLVCIRIFGYTDPAAEKLAEETGVAFQLTNILRDVAEDAERGRVYLPLEDLAAHNVSSNPSCIARKALAPDNKRTRTSAEIGKRAEAYYASAAKLLPLIDRESRPAMWVLVRIYHGLLKRIRRADYDVFSRRISVPTFQKLEILPSEWPALPSHAFLHEIRNISLIVSS